MFIDHLPYYNANRLSQSMNTQSPYIDCKAPKDSVAVCKCLSKLEYGRMKAHRRVRLITLHSLSCQNRNAREAQIAQIYRINATTRNNGNMLGLSNCLIRVLLEQSSNFLRSLL
ncbi:hypothetical protein NPIL_359311 [Nephila pilipes]|uniref:Uncharacterized protein n=1 Tax=Nephila pilipes TaxID=299642 RepID=A0A8X6PPB8_NEPPI|nr:hypothetical protein NPIL_359311 [Nephila pilipes]